MAPKEISPIDWFGSLNQESKNAAIKQFIEITENLDPNRELRAQLWPNNKTVKFDVSLPVSGGSSHLEFPVHVAVNDGGFVQWDRLIGQLQERDLVFDTGWLMDPYHGNISGWTAGFGDSTLIVREVDNDLVLYLTDMSVVNAPEGLDEGIPFPIALPKEEGLVALLFEGQITFVSSYPYLREDEVECARRGTMKIGVQGVTDGLMAFALSISGFTEGWADMPFAIGIEQPENRRLTPVSEGRGRPLNFILVDRTTKRVRVIRPVIAGLKLTREIEKLARKQIETAESYDLKQYDEDIARLYEKWPSPNALGRQISISETFVSPVIN